MTRFLHLQGLTSYEDVHALQRHLLARRIANEIPDTVLLLEHAPTITVGRARQADSNVLDAGDTPVVRVERGGDVTWHGPGQLVAYPIIDLRGRREDLHLHLHSLEDAIVLLLADLGLEAGRDPRNTGVWLPGQSGAQKVCSIGIACRRWVTWHGLALNVDPDPDAFSRINPCGFEANIMTRLSQHLGDVALADLIQPLAEHLATTLDLQPGRVQRVSLEELQKER